MVALWIILAILLIYGIWQYMELKKFKVTEYQCLSAKLQREQRLAVLADLHGFTYGKQNERLIRRLRALRPDVILIAGDMIVSEGEGSYERALTALRQLTGIAPVYYGFGNHESRDLRGCGKGETSVEKSNGVCKNEAFMEYLRRAEAAGVIFLRNETAELVSGPDTLAISGLEIELHYYMKREDVPLEDGCVQKLLGACDREHFQILIAHNPAYSEEYAAWGADLTVCGHNHGGLIRFPGRGSLISPQLTFFPKYDGGQYEIAGKQVVVSRGLGTHTFHIRIFNRAELVLVRVAPDKTI